MDASGAHMYRRKLDDDGCVYVYIYVCIYISIYVILEYGWHCGLELNGRAVSVSVPWDCERG